MSDIVTIDGIPVYQALVDNEATGMLRISLVDDPAVQSNFLAFNKQQPAPKRVQTYVVQDEEKRLVLGVVMRADFPIYRRDRLEDGSEYEYYIIYKPDTIRAMAEKYLAENRQNLVNLMHQDGTDQEGIQMVQYFIKGAGLSPEGFEGIADGSLFAEFHITNDEVWDAVKDGTYKGFSLEGIFDLKPERSKDYVDEVVDALDGIFSRIFHNSKQYAKMKKKGLLARLAKALVEMGNVTTDKGVLSWDGDEEIKVGDDVYIEDENGDQSPAGDGEYTTSDGKVIVVESGKVTDIREASNEPAAENFGRKDTDKGTLIWEGEEDLKAGDSVYVEDEEGNRTAAPDGDYTTEDGKVIVVVDGVVSEIKDAEAEVSPELKRMRRISAVFSETYEDKTRAIYEAIVALGFDPYGYIVEAADDYAIYCTWGENGEKYTRFEVSWDAEGNAVVTNPVEVKPAFVEEGAEPIAPADPAPSEETETLRRENAELKAQLAKLSRTPAGKSAHEELETAPLKTGNKGKDRLTQLMAAK